MNPRRLIPSVLVTALAALAFSSVPALAAIQHSYLSQLTGTPSGSFGQRPSAVAVDPGSQDVYVGDPANDAVDIFSPSGAYLSQITGMAVPGG